MEVLPAPIAPSPIDDDQIPFLHQCYIHTTCESTDTTMIWGTQVDMTRLRDFLAERNATSDVLLSPTAILARAVGLALRKHPDANCRLVGSKIYRFTEQNVVLPILRKTGPALHLLRNVDQLSYEQIAVQLKDEVLQALDPHCPPSLAERAFRWIPAAMRGWCVRKLVWCANNVRMPLRPISRHLNGAPAMINDFGFPCAPPLMTYKASRFGSRSLLINVTLGPEEQRPVVIDETIVIRPMAGLFVRADHRTLEARQLADFVKTIVAILEAPAEHA